MQGFIGGIKSLIEWHSGFLKVFTLVLFLLRAFEITTTWYFFIFLPYIILLLLVTLLILCACYEVFGEKNRLEEFSNPRDKEDNGFDGCLNFVFNHILFDIKLDFGQLATISLFTLRACGYIELGNFFVYLGLVLSSLFWIATVAHVPYLKLISSIVKVVASIIMHIDIIRYNHYHRHYYREYDHHDHESPEHNESNDGNFDIEDSNDNDNDFEGFTSGGSTRGGGAGRR